MFYFDIFREQRDSSSPPECPSPDSIMSTGSASMLSDLSAGRLSGYSGFAFRFPEKLQIVKPMEGKCMCVPVRVCWSYGKYTSYYAFEKYVQ